MRFIENLNFERDALLRTLFLTDRVILFLGRVAYAVSQGGVLGTGLFLLWVHHQMGVFSFVLLKGLHFLFGLVVLIELLYRVSWILVRATIQSREMGLRHTLSSLRVERFALEDFVRWGYALSLGILIFTGFFQFLHYRYGFDVLPVRPAFGFAIIHGITAHFFLTFLGLRIFLFWKFRLRGFLRYLHQP